MENRVELPEIQEFLKLSRVYKRQLKLFKKSSLNKEQKDLIDKVVSEINKTNSNYSD